MKVDNPGNNINFMKVCNHFNPFESIAFTGGYQSYGAHNVFDRVDNLALYYVESDGLLSRDSSY